MDKKTVDTLIRAARTAREGSYCPYSHFAVGAALLTEGGKVYTGANIESASYTPTVCAERVAFFSAVHAGERAFTAIAIVGAPREEAPTALCSPCGVCRQVMSEFCGEDFKIILASESDAKIYTLGELLPLQFKL